MYHSGKYRNPQHIFFCPKCQMNLGRAIRPALFGFWFQLSKSGIAAFLKF